MEKNSIFLNFKLFTIVFIIRFYFMTLPLPPDVTPFSLCLNEVKSCPFPPYFSLAFFAHDLPLILGLRSLISIAISSFLYIVLYHSLVEHLFVLCVTTRYCKLPSALLLGVLVSRDYSTYLLKSLLTQYV